MSIHKAVELYFEAWNAHDGEKAGSFLTDDGLYEDPFSRLPVRKFDIPTTMWALQSILPDFRFEVTAVTATEERASVEWVLHGANTSPFKAGIDPTGKTVHLRGVEIVAGAAGFERVNRYFDQDALFRQIGLQVIVEPFAQGAATYGYSKRVISGNPSAPAVIALTWIHFRNSSELDRIRAHSSKIIQDFLAEPGFISIVTGAAGERAFTVTAWESEEALHRALDKSHARAKHDFRSSDLSPAVWTSVWKAARTNTQWARCAACGQPNDVVAARVCSVCGASLPERQLYW